MIYDFEYQGNPLNYQLETPAKLKEKLDQWIADDCVDHGIMSDDRDGFILTLEWDNHEGLYVVTKREPYTVSYEYYHGDCAEHNTHRGL